MNRRALASVLIGWAAAAAMAQARADEAGDVTPADEGPDTICELVESAAAESDIPIDFFTRLLWKESRFRVAAVSPKGAQGIAQFMPGTAAIRGLADPFDARQAIPASADYLSDLANRFGNLGLAAAAYNAGERRVEDWLDGSGGLPWRLQDYVLAITGRSAEEWALPDLTDQMPTSQEPAEAMDVDEGADPAGGTKEDDPAEPLGCLELVALLGEGEAGLEPLASVLPQAPWAPWGAQVAGNFSASRAMASYTRLQRKHPDLLAGKAPMVVRSVNRSRGRAAFFHIRVPADTRDAAASLCGRLKAAGGACLVVKN